MRHGDEPVQFSPRRIQVSVVLRCFAQPVPREPAYVIRIVAAVRRATSDILNEDRRQHTHGQLSAPARRRGLPRGRAEAVQDRSRRDEIAMQRSQSQLKSTRMLVQRPDATRHMGGNMSNRSNAMANGLSLLSLVLYAGCATSEVSGEADERNLDDSAATEARAIIQIEIEQGHLVSFHEPVPGGLYIAEQMVPGQHFVLGGEAAIDAIAAFSKLRPGVQVPEVLQAAYDRARNLADAPRSSSRHARRKHDQSARDRKPGNEGDRLTRPVHHALHHIESVRGVDDGHRRIAVENSFLQSAYR